MPFTIKLINMPFAALNCPSIALTQLKSVTQTAYPEVAIELLYLNHDFARLIHRETYAHIASGQIGQITGIGDWLFRGSAFPEHSDNKSEYLARFGHHFRGREGAGLLSVIDGFRSGLNSVLDSLIDRYRLAEADLVGFTSMFFQNLASIALAQRLRRRNREQVIVMGGANCEGAMGIELVSRIDVLDFVFSGTSLCSFPRFVGTLLSGDVESRHRIDGVFSRRNSNSPGTEVSADTETGSAPLNLSNRLSGIAEIGRELDINAPVALDYHDFLGSLRRNSPVARTKATLMFETSRGCWWGERAHCTFCGLNGSTMAYRAMHTQRALALIDGLIRDYGNEIDTLQCVDNILPREYIEELFPKLHTPDHISIFYEVKADLPAAALATLARAGVRRVQPGIESLATSTLKLMRKGTTAFGNIRFLMECKAQGVVPEWNLLVGFPAETREIYATYVKVLPLMFHLPPPTGVYPVRFDRFSPYFMMQGQYGLRLEPYDFYRLCYPLPAHSLQRIAYYFQDTNTNAPYIRDVADWLAPLREVVLRWQRMWAGVAPRPELRAIPLQNEVLVEDSRLGTPQRYSISAAEHALLESAATPRLEDRVTPPEEEALRSLARRGLIFRERSRFMALL